MAIGIDDAQGRRTHVEVTPGVLQVGIRFSARPEGPSWSCTPAAARELAAALVRSAGEAEKLSPADPVTVRADGLRRGDVRDGNRIMTVESVRNDGSTAHVTWKSGAGRSWTQAYAADAGITLRYRLRTEA
ncbi:hypothetical protein F0344_32535 [Streptomyces finlayi]|uniref:Uncharacterized protein n=1 Tax=Streptomyces finlayi TaxID=67296 RepID=A0A7G7BTN4_9ACTN|nr:hypothetical protein [Streptomyces finlayi]QNE78699.1 hypothetical protein F0344_32535 [Streptomyces finlayi]